MTNAGQVPAPPSVPLEAALKMALTSLSEEDLQGLKASLRELSAYGPAGLLLLRYGASWAMAESSTGKYATPQERQKALSVMCDPGSPLSAAVPRDALEVLLDILSGEKAEGRKLPDDLVYLTFLAVVFYGTVQAFPGTPWEARYDRLFADFCRYHVRPEK